MTNRDIKLHELALPIAELKSDKRLMEKLIKIKELFVGEDYYSEYNFLSKNKEFIEKLKDLKFKLALRNGSGWFFFDEYFLFNVNVKLEYTQDHKMMYLNDSVMIYVVPISKIKINIKEKKNNGTYQSTPKQGSAVKGAIVGGALAGTTGAVIGATAASKPNTPKSHFYSDGTYILEMYANFVNPYEFKLFKYDKISKKIEPNKEFYLNMMLMNKHYTLFDSPDLIIADYQSVLDEISKVTKRIQKKEDCMELIYNIYKLNPKINIYTKDLNFINSLYNIFISLNKPELNNCLSNIKNKIVEVEEDKKVLRKQINAETVHLNSLKSWQITKKSQITDRIEKLQKILDNQDDLSIYIDEVITSLKNTPEYVKLYNKQKWLNDQHKNKEENFENHLKTQLKNCIYLYYNQNSDYIICLKNIKNTIDADFDNDIHNKSKWYQMLNIFCFLLKNDGGYSISEMKFKNKEINNMSNEDIGKLLKILLKLNVVEEFLNIYDIKKND